MTKRRFSPQRFFTNLERRLITELDASLESAFKLPIPDSGTEKHPFADYSGSDWRLYSFFELMQFAAPEGFLVGARVLFEGLEERGSDRALTSFVLTRIARMVYETPYVPDRPPRESEVGFMGAFISSQLPLRTTEVLEWFEDMRDGNDECGLPAQPAQVPRGVLMSSDFDHRNAKAFWIGAAKSRRFPVGIFSEPCLPEDGRLFSEYHCRRFGAMFEQMPEEAVARFATEMRDNARRYARWEKSDAPFEKKELVFLEADERQRVAVLCSVLSHIRDEKRRTLVHDLLFPAPPSDPDAPDEGPQRTSRHHEFAQEAGIDS